MISITEYQWQQIKNYLPKEPANNALIFEIERQAQTNAQQAHGEICPHCNGHGRIVEHSDGNSLRVHQCKCTSVKLSPC